MNDGLRTKIHTLVHSQFRSKVGTWPKTRQKMPQSLDNSSKCSRNLTPKERSYAATMLLSLSTDFRLEKGAIKEVAANFCCSTKTISRLWKRTAQGMKDGHMDGYQAQRKGRCGRRRLISAENAVQLWERIELIPHADRQDIRTLADRLGMSPSTLHRYFMEKLFRRHSAALKPLLTTKNRIDRVKFALSFVDEPAMQFDPLLDHVHVDEKWFYMQRTSKKIYLSPREDDPHFVTKSKSFIEKVMVLVAIARPRFDHHRKKMFDGRIGMWPFVQVVPAVRNSKNRPAGTPVLQSVTVTRDVYRHYLVSHVIPTIKKVWPAAKTRKIVVQQDNAKPHVLLSDEAVAAACREDGWNIELRAQPANSPDCNVLDLGFFSSIQSLQIKKPATSMEGLIENIRQAFSDLHFTKIDRVFMSFQYVLNEILANSGGNRFRIPHVGKSSLLMKSGLLPTRITCDTIALETARSMIESASVTEVLL